MPKKKNKTTGKPSRNTSIPFDFSTPNYLDTPTKPIEIEKPINGFDYLNALVRIPEVKKDLESLGKKPTKEKRLELINKYWGIDEFMFLLNTQDTRAFHKRNKYFHNSESIHVFSNWEKEPLLGGRWEHDPLSKYRDGRHVILAVDVTKKKRNIINEFKKLLYNVKRDYRMLGDTTRDKETVENIWEIYDYKTKDKLGFLAIAKKKTGLNDNPAVNPKLDACLQMVKRAYHKAEGIINTVKREVEKAITENAKRQKAHNELMEMISRMAEVQRKKGRTITIADRLLQGISNKTKRK